jgi:hypothetical protein
MGSGVKMKILWFDVTDLVMFTLIFIPLSIYNGSRIIDIVTQTITMLLLVIGRSHPLVVKEK